MSKNSIYALVSQFLGQQNNISVPVPLVRITGDYTAAAFVSQVMYWSDRTTDPGGWFYKSHEEWHEELHLSSDQVRRCVKTAGGMIEVKRAGVPARNFYRINRELLIERLQDLANARIVSTSRNGETQHLDVGKPNAKSLGKPTTSRTADPISNTKITTKITTKSGGASNLEEDTRAQAAADRPAPDLASTPCTTTDQASLQNSVAPDRTPTVQALLEPPDTLSSDVSPDGGGAHAPGDLVLTDADVDELFAPGNVDDTSPGKIPAAAGGAVPALRVADLVPIPRVELVERPAAVPSSAEHRMIRSLVTGKQIDAGLLEQATPTGGLSRQDWLRLTLDEIGLVKTAAQSEAQAEGTGFVTLAIRGLDRMIGAVRREASGPKAEAGGTNPDAVARYDPKLPVGARCTVAGQLGVVWQVTNAVYLVDRDDGERVTVDRAAPAQLRRLKASAAPAPSGPVGQPAQPDALGALGSKWQPRAGGDALEVTAIEGAARIMSDGSRVPVYTLTSKFTPA